MNTPSNIGSMEDTVSVHVKSMYPTDRSTMRTE